MKIAERRVRLGLVLAELGRVNGVEVKDEEVARAIQAEAARFPGQERQVYEFFQKNPNAVASLRAPLYEEKVVDFVLQMAKVEDVKVSRAELESEDEVAPAADAKPAKKAAAKAPAKATAKKEEAPVEEAVAEEKPAPKKKAPAKKKAD
jgi:trigger factor